MKPIDHDLLAELSGAYYDYCLGKGVTSREVLLSTPLTAQERARLQAEMKLIDLIHGLISHDRSLQD